MDRIVEVVISVGILAIFGLLVWVMSPKHPERIENLRKKIFSE